MKDSLKKGLIIGAAGSAICVLWHHLLTKKMMQLAMDRVAPQDRSNGKMRVSGSPEMIETTEIVKKAAGQLEKSGCDVVEITAHDGISLIGHWCPCEEPKRTIVAMHGWRSSWSHDFGLLGLKLLDGGQLLHIQLVEGFLGGLVQQDFLLMLLPEFL